MKASRLLHLLLLLQVRQRVTTTELAERLEVSRRTVLRDVESLSAAGVPVYAERGRRGGIVLLSGARLNASHLDPAELEALSLTGLDAGQLEMLGLSAAHQAAARKIDARAATGAEDPALARLADLVHVESAAWFAGPGAGVDVADLAWKLRAARRLTIEYRRSAETRTSTLEVDPYGLVAKSGRWYLIGDVDGEGRLFALERLSGYRSLDTPAVLRDGETLRSVWAALKERTESAGGVSVTVRLRASRVDLAHRILGTRLGPVAVAQNGWCTAVVHYPDLASVRQLLQFGDHLEVLSPDAAREVIHRLAQDLARRHAPHSPGDD